MRTELAVGEADRSIIAHERGPSTYVSSVRIRVLGPVDAFIGDEPIALGGPKQIAVLALLVAQRDRSVSIGSLIQGVYGHDAAVGARRTIQTYVSNLRQAVGGIIERSGDGYRLDTAGIAIDAAEFEAAVGEAAEIVDTDPAPASRMLWDALGMWRGRPFAGIDTYLGLEDETARMEDLRLHALSARIDADLACGRHSQLIGELDALATQHPYRERFRAQHMIALYRSGRQTEALRAFTTTREILADELGIDPSPELQDLEQAILDHDPVLDPPIGETIEAVTVLVGELDGTMTIDDPALERRDHRFATAVSESGGEVAGVSGLAVYASFFDTASAVRAAKALAVDDLRLAVDRGDVEMTGAAMTGPPVSRALRLAAVAHPGQVLISGPAHDHLSEDALGGWSVLSLGTTEIRGVDTQLRVFQLTDADLRRDFPALDLDRLPPPLPHLAAVASVAGYELRDRLRADAAGNVFRAYQASVGREVAVRTIRRDVVSEPRFIRRFEAHARRVASTEHPHLVPMLDAWREPDDAYLVHGLVNGALLAEVASSRTIDPAQGRELLDKVGAAVAAAHDEGLAHGRIGPDAVLIDGSGEPWVADLGLAAMLHDLVRFEPGPYDAPETAVTGPTQAGDVYSFGAMVAFLHGTENRDVEDVVRRATATAAADRFGSIPDLLDAIDASQRRRRQSTASPRTSVRNPYKGLAAFRESDAGDLYGRERLIRELIEEVRTHRLVSVIGPSGVGKSSIVRAGLIPAIRTSDDPAFRNALVTDMLPGARPFDSLEQALARVAVTHPGASIEGLRSGRVSLGEVSALVLPAGSCLILLIDQFEELFTLVPSEDERRRFLAMLTTAAEDDGVRTILTLRADHHDRPLRYAEFGTEMSRATLAVTSPSAAELAEIIDSPARSVGVTIDQATTTVLVDEASDQIGGLPLLQHMLTELFENRTSDRIGMGDYEKLGRLATSIGRSAEAIHHSLGSEDQETSREIFSRLVTVDESADDTRRRASRSELDTMGRTAGSVQRVLDAFGRHRLLVFDSEPKTRAPTVEVAHEALIRHWPRLRTWIDERRDDLLIERKLELETSDWIGSGEDPGFLLRGGRLERVESWVERSGMTPTPDQRRLIDESRRVVDDEADRRRRNRQRVLTSLVAALAVVSVLGTIAVVQRGIAQRRTIETQVNDLATSALLALEEDPSLAINLAIEAYDRSTALPGRTPGEVMTALQTTLQGSKLLGILPGELTAAVLDPTSRRLIGSPAEDMSTIIVYDLETFEELDRFAAGGPVADLDLSPDGASLFVGYDLEAADDATLTPELPIVRAFDPSTFERTLDLSGECCAHTVAVSPDGLHVFAATTRLDPAHPDCPVGGDTTVWRMGEPDPLARIDGWVGTGWLQAGQSILLRSDHPDCPLWESDQTLAVYSMDRADVDHITPLEEDASGVVAESSSLVAAVVSQSDDIIRLYQPGQSSPIAELPTEGGAGAAFSSDGSSLAVFGNDDQIHLIDLETEDRLELRGHVGGPHGFFSRDDDLFIALSGGGTLVWDVTGAETPGLIFRHGDVSDFQLWADDRRITVESEAGAGSVVRIYDMASGAQLSEAGPFGTGFWAGIDISGSGRTAGGLGPGDTDGMLLDIVTGERLLTTPWCSLPQAISDDDRYVVIGGGGYCEESLGGSVVDLESGSPIVEWDELPLASTFGVDGTASRDLAVVNHDAENFEVVHLPTGTIVNSFAVDIIAFWPQFSSDGSWLVLPSFAGEAWVIDTEAIAAGEDIETAIAFKAVVTGGPTQGAIASGAFLGTYHSGDFRVWDIETGEQWFILRTDMGSARFTADSRYLIYADEGGVVRRMPLDPADLADMARTRKHRDYTVDECQRYLPDDVDCSIYEAA